ncbi:PadR family transcriptional regulator [Bacillus sp. ISL-53]|nr:PadR family transcriptional regulator [Bacillus sp. ISL-53]
MTIEELILGFLSIKPASGYEIKAEVQQKLGGFIWGSISSGNLYPKLNEMKEKGLLVAFNNEDNARNKKTYELTKDGWIQLERWLGSPSNQQIIKDELLLKMMFWGVGRSEDTEIIIEQLYARRTRTKELLSIIDDWDNYYNWIDQYGLLTLDYGQKVLNAELEWIEETLQKLQGQRKWDKGIDRNNLRHEQEERKKSAKKDLGRDKQN